MKAGDIIALVQDIRTERGTNDPYEIAESYGIKILFRDVNMNEFVAQTTKIDGYPTIIAINNKYSELSKKVLCAHELGHALLHQDLINHFAVTKKNVSTNVEYEANLFALALLADESVLAIPFEKMSSSVIKNILDYNIHV